MQWNAFYNSVSTGFVCLSVCFIICSSAASIHCNLTVLDTAKTCQKILFLSYIFIIHLLFEQESKLLREQMKSSFLEVFKKKPHNKQQTGPVQPTPTLKP